MNCFFSIIIPVYKVEYFLRDCVDSVLQQTFSNFEVILVDDGSSDGCPAICDEYATNDSRVKVIHKINGGLSDARNTGIINSTGEWIIFLDSDDKLANKNVLSQLSDFIIEDNSKIIFCPKLARFSKTDFSKFCNYTQTEKLSASQLFDYVQVSGSLFAAWLFVTNSQVLKQSNLYFKKNILHEDMDWIPRVIDVQESISIFPFDFYLYRINENSITSLFYSKRFDDLMYTINWISDSEKKSEFLIKWFNMLCYTLYVNMESESKCNHLLFVEHIKILKQILKLNKNILNKRNTLILFFMKNHLNLIFYKLRKSLK